MKSYHALIKKDKPVVMTQFVQSSMTALSTMGIKVVRSNDGPLASVAFESDLPLEQLKDLLKDRASLVTEITPMSIPKDVGGRIRGFLGKDYTITTATSLSAMGFDKVWADAEFNGGANLTFCIIDTGLDPEYYQYTPNDPRADWYFRDRVLEVFKARPWSGQCHFHGRVCASVIAKGIHEYEGQIWRGALPKIKFYVAQGLDSQGYGDSDTIHACMVWGLSKKPHAITMSLGGTHDPMLDEDVERCWAEGIPVIVAAGNNGTWPPDCDGSLNCPADAPNSLACGATNAGHVPEGETEKVQPWSARAQRPDGTKHDWFFVGAGCDILVEMGEPRVSGTSLTAPHNTASVLTTILMVKLRNPTLSAQQVAIKIREILRVTALNLGYLGSPEHTTEGAYCLQGWGRIQAGLAWTTAKGETTSSKISKVEFYLNNLCIGEATTGTNDVFQLAKVLVPGDHLWKGKAYSEGLEPVETETFHIKVVKPTPGKKIDTHIKGPLDGTEVQEGTTIIFQVNAKVVEQT